VRFVGIFVVAVLLAASCSGGGGSSSSHRTSSGGGSSSDPGCQFIVAGQRVQVKHLMVRPGGTRSLQMPPHRA